MLPDNRIAAVTRKVVAWGHANAELGLHEQRRAQWE
jgi:hypothetical protein